MSNNRESKIILSGQGFDVSVIVPVSELMKGRQHLRQILQDEQDRQTSESVSHGQAKAGRI